MPTKTRKIILMATSIAILAAGLYLTRLEPGSGQAQVVSISTQGEAGLWRYRCIDTVKFSRDEARQWKGKQAQLSVLIDRQLSAVKDLGANCVAIGTPYDSEFVPYLTQWVAKAREKGLAVWFRGNFSGWEGWFSYPLLSGPQQHNQLTFAFITSNPGLFRDGDIFTPAPEPENGKVLGYPFASAANRQAFLDFLSSSFDDCRKAFAQIKKEVNCGYFSVNGDVAKNILTPAVIGRIGGVVVVDNYVKTSQQMASDLQELHQKFRSPVALGEFGAPIPDINGPMTDSQQASFVNQILGVLYQDRGFIPAVNYWVLQGGTTALLNDDGSLKPAANVIKRFYRAAVVRGRVVNTLGQGLPGVTVKVGDYQAATDAQGSFVFPVPAVQEADLVFERAGFAPVSISITISQNANYELFAKLHPQSPGPDYALRYFASLIAK